MDLIIENGIVVTPQGSFRASVGVEGEKIAAVATHLPTDGATVIDASGKYVLPGAIDAHTHMEWPGSADDFEDGTIAAACGGVTTIIDFAVQYHGRTLRETITEWRNRADPKVCIDYGLHLVVSELTENAPDEIESLMADGVTSLKMWMTSSHSGGLGVSDRTIIQVLQIAARMGALVGLHCENDAIIHSLAADFLAEGGRTAAYHAPSRPPIVEAEAIHRVCTYAGATGSNLYIPHISSGAGLAEVLAAQRRGVRVVAETCPHYLALTSDVYCRPDAARFVMSPPLKGISDQEALWEALNSGAIATVGSDHCPYSDEMKASAPENFLNIPNGVPGTEVILPILYGEGVARKRLTIERLAAVTAENPARLFGLFPRKGVIRPGSDADLVIFDPERPTRLDTRALHSRIGYSIYDDLTVPGYPVVTLSRGEIIYQDGQFQGRRGAGRYLPRAVPEPGIWEAIAHA